MVSLSMLLAAAPLVSALLETSPMALPKVLRKAAIALKAVETAG